MIQTSMSSVAPIDEEETADWVRAFHAGEPRTMAGCYRDHFEVVERSVAAVLVGADKETVVQEVFFRLVSREEVRRSFQSGAFVAWLRVVARNCAIDYCRRYGREAPAGRWPGDDARPAGEAQQEAGTD